MDEVEDDELASLSLRADLSQQDMVIQSLKEEHQCQLRLNDSINQENLQHQLRQEKEIRELIERLQNQCHQNEALKHENQELRQQLQQVEQQLRLLQQSRLQVPAQGFEQMKELPVPTPRLTQSALDSLNQEKNVGHDQKSDPGHCSHDSGHCGCVARELPCGHRLYQSCSGQVVKGCQCQDMDHDLSDHESVFSESDSVGSSISESQLRCLDSDSDSEYLYSDSDSRSPSPAMALLLRLSQEEQEAQVRSILFALH